MTTITAVVTTFDAPNCTSYIYPLQRQTKIASESFEKVLEDIKNRKEKYELKQNFLSLNKMKNWKPNWDSHGAKAPQKKAIIRAENFIRTLYQFIEEYCYDWISPNITSSSSGEIVFEWWKNQKKITVYLSAKEISYIKIYNENIDDMEDGILELNINSISPLWNWLIS